MKIETVRIHFLSDVSSLLSSENLLPWQHGVTTFSSVLFWNSIDAKNVLVRADVT